MCYVLEFYNKMIYLMLIQNIHYHKMHQEWRNKIWTAFHKNIKYVFAECINQYTLHNIILLGMNLIDSGQLNLILLCESFWLISENYFMLQKCGNAICLFWEFDGWGRILLVWNYFHFCSGNAAKLHLALVKEYRKLLVLTIENV